MRVFFKKEVRTIDRLVGVFGHPIKHSMSPDMHNAAFRSLGLPYSYAAFDVDPADLPAAAAAVRALGLAGVNVTIPHKVAVMDHLDWIDPSACIIGAVNTIVNENGRLLGYNTDGDGYLRSLMEECAFNPVSKRVLVLGASGAARGIVCSLLASGISFLTVANRTRIRADEFVRGLAERFAELLGRPLPAEVGVIDWDTVRSCLEQFDLVINTTSVGMWPNVDAMPVEGAVFRPGQIISDIVYNPLETKWLAAAKQQGAVAHDGLGMFVYQGAIAFQKWTGAAPPIEVMRKVVADKLRVNTQS